MNKNESVSVNENGYQLKPIDQLKDWQVENDEKDCRGWEFCLADGQRIGQVKNLIANTGLKKVQYLDVELDEKVNGYRDLTYRSHVPEDYHPYLGSENDRRTLVPVGTVDLDEKDQKVVAAPNLNIKDFSNSPRYQEYTPTTLGPVHEILVAQHYSRNDDTNKSLYDNFDLSKYRSKHFISEDGFYTSDLFSRRRYFDRYRNYNPSMTGFNTGMPK